ncbi:MAG: right-handed parallel beta-helix repeat-containing protein [Candidatus Sumerlaeota bacterium]|nr:right-handed parallel beta-helix repeat-containing protein [Candidatus Sumerlaeota bacterium]
MKTLTQWFTGRAYSTTLLMCCVLSLVSPGAEEGSPRPAVLPTSGAPQSAPPRAVCTFESIGLYWTPADGAEDRKCRVQYRIAGSQAWREALPMWFDKRIGEYRGSIVQLRSGTQYEVRLELTGSGTSAELKATTWNESFPIAMTVEVGDMKGRTLVVDQSGAAGGYVLYTHRAGAPTAMLDGADSVDQCVEVKASFVILRELTIRAPKIHGIVLGQDSHDVVIEGCDISGWGRIEKDGWGVDYDSAVFSRFQPLKRVIIQRNRMHDPRSNANCWQEFREGGERYHPKGPQAIFFSNSEGNNVLRYNEFTTDDRHFCNDIFGGENNKSLRGYPGTDSDVYGNRVEGCWDDGLEIEGGGCNVRVWGNYIDRTMVKIAIAGMSVGPAYLFRNVAGTSRFGRQGWGGGTFIKMGHAPLTGGGRAYIFHNTILQPKGPPQAPDTIGCDEGFAQSGGPELLGVVSRNNILHIRKVGGSSIRDASKAPAHDYDYDLLSGKVVSAGSPEPHGIKGVPIYAPNRVAGDFSLDPGSPGFDAGEVIPNFNDGFAGKAPDVGAFEAGAPPMEFGVKAYMRH